ncbi:hypothetical protein J4573_04470 [Actinomadura barringtoniae]|uniref:DUF11 domain-containing protein n=1 Tax=Actinomadura barringtoniae TaxID=1427535 RepID=A0A939T4U7_9ACTN|nr:DUF11 domain-containing protein [Actinomadura barringtoniae]MBO2446332.1 hypothetical protein [Actinomadura barringtoniae]
MRPFLRSLCLLASAALILCGLSIPALADPPEVEVTASRTTASPGDTVTVTVKVTNVHSFTILGAHAQLLSNPGPLTSQTTLEGCTGGTGPCTTFNNGSDPVGYEAPVGSISGGGSATVVFTLKVASGATAGAQVLQGAISGSNYGTFPFDGPTLNVITDADAAVRLTAAPRLGILVPRIDFTVKVTGNGPADLNSAQVTTTLPPGTSGSGCTPAAGKVTCSFGHIAVGSSSSSSFSVPLGLLNIGVPYTFTATRTASSPHDPTPGNDVSTVQCTVVTLLLVTCQP